MECWGVAGGGGRLGVVSLVLCCAVPVWARPRRQADRQRTTRRRTAGRTFTMVRRSSSAFFGTDHGSAGGWRNDRTRGTRERGKWGAESWHGLPGKAPRCRFPSAWLRAGFRLTTPKLCPNEQRPLIGDPGTTFGAPFAQNDSAVLWCGGEEAASMSARGARTMARGRVVFSCRVAGCSRQCWCGRWRRAGRFEG